MVWGAVLFLASCSSTVEGLCEDDSDCLAGLSCQGGVCVGCGGDDQCKAWQACTADRRCELREGMCEKSAQCKSWETCGANNTCVVASGACATAADCKAHESCDEAAKRCVLQEGRCNTADDCNEGALWTSACGADNQCHTEEASGNDVLIWGTLMEGICGYDAISSVLTPLRVQVGFGCYTTSVYDDAVVSPNGRVYYVDRAADPQRVKIFNPDPFKVEGGKRTYPPQATDNDTKLPAPGCKADQDLGTFVLQAGTGAIAYSCNLAGTDTTYYDTNGAVVAAGYELLAWNADNHLLAQTGGFKLFVLTPDRTPLPVTGLPSGWAFRDARATTAGFWLAISLSGTDFQLWRVGHDGVATLQGNYGALPQGVTGYSAGVLDRSGALYVEGTLRDATGDLVDIVVQRPPDGTTATIVYSEANAPEKVNYAADYKVLFNFMHISYLFAGP
ncbi:hypothetical protein JYK02_12890 [Corallococcus macrosporus]|uniref:Lipoprotein n=1 Tax=Corallococcus macrosporus TaxID=35 RepID=A0ABS3D9N6_9BACT|nr:hypothetical protein [Corallococcus macrosporus]MBN8228399.1 hypothetical protein [Corallococcus macrosporus]